MYLRPNHELCINEKTIFPQTTKFSIHKYDKFPSMLVSGNIELRKEKTNMSIFILQNIFNIFSIFIHIEMIHNITLELENSKIPYQYWGRHGNNSIILGLISTHAISAYHH